jgi:aryl-alcohol dehydrogenase
MKTLAAVVQSPKAQFTVAEIELPQPASHDVLVRIVGVGICHTDLASRDGLLPAPFPSVFGHEGAGIVEAVGSDVTKVAPGDHVVLAPASDGTCVQCQEGAPMYCEHFNELNFQTNKNGPAAVINGDGRAYIKYFGQSSFAHFALASERNTVKVPETAPLEILGPLGCGIQTGAGTVINGIRPSAGSSIVVLGTGAVGLAAILGAVVCGCAAVIAVDRVASRLELAKSLGATHGINTNSAHDLAAAIRKIVPLGADFIIDSAGVPALITAALGGLSRLGVLGLVAVPPTADRLLELPWFSMLLQGQIVQGFIEGNSIPDIFIPRLVQLHAQGRFPFDKLIRRYPFNEINEAIEDMKTGETVKAVLTMGHS